MIGDDEWSSEHWTAKDGENFLVVWLAGRCASRGGAARAAAGGKSLGRPIKARSIDFPGRPGGPDSTRAPGLELYWRNRLG
jgi:hypothetical protein